MKLTADGVGYEFPERPTMGELRTLKKVYDLARPDDLDFRNIDHVAGLLHIAIQRAHPQLPASVVEERVNAVHKIDIEAPEEEPAEERPTVPAESAEAGS